MSEVRIAVLSDSQICFSKVCTGKRVQIASSEDGVQVQKKG